MCLFVHHVSTEGLGNGDKPSASLEREPQAAVNQLVWGLRTNPGLVEEHWTLLTTETSL